MLSHTTRARAPAAAALGFVVIALSVSACGRGESSSAADGARDAVMTVTAVALERVELTRTISMNGSLYAWQDVIISSEVGGYRVAEVLGTGPTGYELSDIYTFVADRTAAGGAVEGTFVSSGSVPRVADTLKSRGIQLEAALFSRPLSR